jgi:hypothetical protein
MLSWNINVSEDPAASIFRYSDLPFITAEEAIAL